MRPGSLSLDAFLARRASDRRLARLTHDVGLPEGRGLEFGPADNPIPLPDGLSITYIDRSRDVGAGFAGAVPIDHAWSGSGALTALLGRDDYDFALAAQVGQYVPNLLGWLRGIHAALRPGGVLNLSLPDKRFMFDAARPVSTLAELIEADLLAYERPSPRQIFGHTHDVRAITPEGIWMGEDPVHAPRMAGEAALPHAYAEAAAALAAGAYVACHCWVLTPLAFLDLVEGATRLGLFPFVLNHVSATQPDGFEFYVSMRRDAQTEAGALLGLQVGAIDHLRGLLEARRHTAKLMAGF